MRISDWSSDVCSSDLCMRANRKAGHRYNLMEWSADSYDFDIYLGRFLALRIHNGRLSNANRDQDFRSLGTGSRHAGRAAGKYRRGRHRSEEHTSELQSLMRISYAVFCLQHKNTKTERHT